MGFSTSGYDVDGAVSPVESPAATDGPGGPFMPPLTGFNTSGYDVTADVGNGISATGVVTRDGQETDGQVYVFWKGEFVGTVSFSIPIYGVAAPPPGSVTDGSDGELPTGDNKVIIETESGGLKEQTFTGASTTLDADFQPLDILVTDVESEPVAGATVWIDNLPLTTDSNGEIAAETSGTVTVTGLYTSVEKEVDVDATSSVSFQFGGVRGQVTNLDGEPIGGKPVTLLVASNGVTRVSTITNEDGEFDFTEAGIEDYYVKAEPYFRPVTPPAEGEYAVKNFPATILYLGEFDEPETIQESELANFSLRFFDGITGDPIEHVPIQRGQWESTSDPLGYARGLSLPGESDAPVIVGEGDRRYVEIEIDPSKLDPSTAYRLELDRNIESSRK